MADLFDNYDELPDEVKAVLTKHAHAEGYSGCNDLKDDLELIGYTCDYGLDAVPHSLQKL